MSIEIMTMEKAFYLQSKAFFEKNNEHINEIARLKAEVERSTTQYNSIIDHQLAVIEGKQAEIDRLNAELFTCSCANANMNKHMNENARLKAEVERLRKAGDAMLPFFIYPPYEKGSHKAVLNWNAAKEGKPSV